MFRQRALGQFRSHCKLLEGYGEVFWCAGVVSGLGNRVIREMERVVVECDGPRDGVRQDKEQQQQEGSTEGESVMPCEGNGNGTGSGDAIPVAHGSGVGVGTSVMGGNVLQGGAFDMDMSLDVFGQFDPRFNLGAVDDVLENNLDIGLPLNWGEWEQFYSPGTYPEEGSSNGPYA
jgi:hypothetical protein